MSSFNPTKLSVTFIPPLTRYKPVERRKYTLTHSDRTGNLFLTIGYCYDVNAINPMLRDEVLAEWVPQMGQYVLRGKVYISGGEYDEQYSNIRFLIFQRELNKALTAIVYGDRELFQSYPWLLDSPIYIQFDSNFQSFNRMLYYGTPRTFLASVMD